jgi:hypothetical protein
LKIATPSGPADDGLAVEGEGAGAQLGGRAGDGWIAAAPVVAAPREQPHRIAVPADLQAVAVVFDLMDPVWAGRRLVGARWDAGNR